MPGPFDLYSQSEDHWSLQGSLGGLVYPLGASIAGWATARGAASVGRGGGFLSGILGGGMYNARAAKEMEDAFIREAGSSGMYSNQARMAFQRAAQSTVGSGAGASTLRTMYGRYGSNNITTLPKSYFPSSIAGARGARLMRTSSSLKFAGRMLGAYIMANIAVNVGQAVTDAALDYRPRSYTSPATEFGSMMPMDSRSGFTQRQRALAAIHDSQLTTRATIGNEASFMHR